MSVVEEVCTSSTFVDPRFSRVTSARRTTDEEISTTDDERWAPHWAAEPCAPKHSLTVQSIVRKSKLEAMETRNKISELKDMDSQKMSLLDLIDRRSIGSRTQIDPLALRHFVA